MTGLSWRYADATSPPRGLHRRHEPSQWTEVMSPAGTIIAVLAGLAAFRGAHRDAGLRRAPRRLLNRAGIAAGRGGHRHLGVITLGRSAALGPRDRRTDGAKPDDLAARKGDQGPWKQRELRPGTAVRQPSHGRHRSYTPPQQDPVKFQLTAGRQGGHDDRQRPDRGNPMDHLHRFARRRVCPALRAPALFLSAPRGAAQPNGCERPCLGPVAAGPVKLRAA
jgi:hypothetical protein